MREKNAKCALFREIGSHCHAKSPSELPRNLFLLSASHVREKAVCCRRHEMYDFQPTKRRCMYAKAKEVCRGKAGSRDWRQVCVLR